MLRWELFDMVLEHCFWYTYYSLNKIHGYGNERLESVFP